MHLEDISTAFFLQIKILITGKYVQVKRVLMIVHIFIFETYSAYHS